MFDELIYQTKLRRFQRKRAATVELYRKKWQVLRAEKGDRDAREELRSREKFDLDEWDEEISQLTTEQLVASARNLIVPLPPYEDEKAWFVSKMFWLQAADPRRCKNRESRHPLGTKGAVGVLANSRDIGSRRHRQCFRVLAYFRK